MIEMENEIQSKEYWMRMANGKKREILLETSGKYDKEFQTREWVDCIPFIKFPDNFLVKIIPPFLGASIRFQVRIDGSEKVVSVYLDCYEILGASRDSLPYWEIYLLNYLEEPIRYSVWDTNGLIEGINSLFKKDEK